MLQLSVSYINKPILSLRTGGTVGTVISAIINPNNLKVEGFYCSDKFSKEKLILLSQEIREVINDGVVVDDHEAMSDENDLVRLKKIISLNFTLVGKKVMTDSKQSLGKINDYAINSDSMFVQKMYVTQPLVKSFNGGQLSIDRSQIIEITDKKVVVQDPTVLVNNKRPMPSPATA